MKTIVVNMFAGPGAGKTTCAWQVASELKKRGYITEYVPEYAKELVWDKNFDQLDGTLDHQKQLLEVQAHRLERLKGQVDFIVTDSPLMLNAIYLTGSPEEMKRYTDQVYRRFAAYDNFSVFIQRGKSFEQAGRIHDLEQSRKIDQQIKDLLHDYKIYYGTYTYETVRLVTDNCIKTYSRVNQAAAFEERTKAKYEVKTDTPPTVSSPESRTVFVKNYHRPRETERDSPAPEQEKARSEELFPLQDERGQEEIDDDLEL